MTDADPDPADPASAGPGTAGPESAGPDTAGSDPATLGRRAHVDGRLDEARGHYAAALARDPGDAGLWTNLGALLRRQGHRTLARHAQARAFALAPRDSGIRNNLANALLDDGEPARALDLRRGLMADAPDDPAHPPLAGKALRALGRLDEAADLLRAAHVRFPDAAEIEIQLALTLLARGDHAQGFRHYRARWRGDELQPRRLAEPQWSGGSTSGRPLLILPEQGFGDAICFARFAAPFAATLPPDTPLAMAVKPPLARLLADVPGVATGPSAPVGGFGAWIDLMDLPLHHFAAGRAIPPPVRLTVPADARARATARMAPFAGRPVVGVVWTGSMTYRGNAARSLPHTAFHALLDLPVQLVSLYKGPGLAAVHADGTAALIPDLGGDDRDFADTAALMERCDLVVTTDTATAHIAGSLGRPVWTLLHADPFWLWGPTGGTTPWYPSMRLIRQERPGDWDGVMARVRAGLQEMAR